jgi:flavin-dependent dehydrogenase
MEYDALIIGGGPAGATAGRLLALWGHRVVLLEKPQPAARSFAETLPPSCANVFAALKIQAEIAEAGFFRTGGNTSWWAGRRKRVEAYAPGRRGWQVLRAEFDTLLLRLAAQAGVEIRRGNPDIAARFTLDCSGRAGVLARRGYRVPEPGHRTVALCGIWTSDHAWRDVDPTHTIVESYRDGWAWVIPLSPRRRYVTIMADPRRRPRYVTELQKTARISGMLKSSRMEGDPWGCDASLYHARCYAAPGALLVGEAGSALDPLSSFGVKTAMTSALVAAIAVHTCLRRPERTEAALGFYDRHERNVYDARLSEANRFYRAAAEFHRGEFWQARARPRETARLPRRRLVRSPQVRWEPRPVISGNELVMRAGFSAPGLPDSPWMSGVYLPAILEATERPRRAAEIARVYRKRGHAATRSAWVSALSFLLARGVLIESPEP